MMNKFFLLIIGLLILASCNTQAVKIIDQSGNVCEHDSLECTKKEKIFSIDEVQTSGILNKDYPAPELVGLENWVNSPGYDSLEELKGKVVLIDFWTLGCVNCIHTLPHLNELYETYNEQGFEILGLHAPEFAYERKLEAVQRAVDQYDLKYPIAQDNDFATWKAYKNRYWPAHYLIDREGQVRYVQFGQGRYDTLEQAIKKLLAEPIILPSPSQIPPLKEEDKNIQRGFAGDNLLTNTAISSIELDDILDGGPGKDGIPAIDSPKFLTQQEVEIQMPYLGVNSQGIVLSNTQGTTYYPYDILVWHEIVNDMYGTIPVSVTFCPLCGSAIVYERVIDGQELRLGVSGKLYQSNLLMYDNITESLWSQSLGEALVGEKTGTKLQLVDANLMSYPEFQKVFPNGKVLSDDTGFNRSYGIIPYGNYDENDSLYFPVKNNNDTRFHKKKLFYIVSHGEKSIAFGWDELRENGVAHLEVDGHKYTGVFKNSLAEVTFEDQVLPGYFEMWFSWINHNTASKYVWPNK